MPLICARMIAVFSIVISTTFASLSPAHAERRVALVVGNGAYTAAGRLPNATNDADDVATALRRLDFDVTIEKNLAAAGFETAVTAFAAKARGADVALFYFAGHALQLGATNYLMPTDVRLATELAVKRGTIAAQDIVEQLENAARTTLVFLDGCRNNPLADRLKSTLDASGRSATIGRGLARLAPKGRDTLIVYSAEPGTVAADGLAGARNSPFAAGFLKHIDTPGLEVETLLKRVTTEVAAATANAQQPERLSKLQSEFYFKRGGAAAAASDAELARLRAENERQRIEMQRLRGTAKPPFLPTRAATEMDP